MATTTKGISAVATRANQTLTGTAFDDRLRGYNDATTLSGGDGNDMYFLGSTKNIVIEAAGGGIDGIQSYWSHALQDYIENLEILGDNTYGIGNSLDNAIIGGNGRQQIYGGAGNDVLTGGAGADTFIFKPEGGGADRITDFAADDFARIGSYGFSSFGQVVENMVQVGSSVVLKLNDTDSVTFDNRKIADFIESNFRYSLDTSKLTLTFQDDFNSLSLQANGGTWRTSFFIDGSMRTLTNNGEKQVYMDPGYKGLGINPFSIDNGVLTIHAERASASVAKIIGNEFTSGMLSSKSTFSQTYGYFEVKAELPAGQGTWPAFWLLPADGNWPPELDVFEVLGNDTSVAYTTSHTTETGAHTAVGAANWVGDLSKGMHTYGLLWTKEQLVWYIDGEEVFRTATPADMHKPMYMVTNLAIGGHWPGNPNASFTSADMKIDYIKAYSVAADATGPFQPNLTDTHPAASANEILRGSAISDVLDGRDGDDLIYGSSGNDILRGGLGDDRLYGGAGNDQIGGKEGHDTLFGEAGEDTIWGDAGNDIISGGAGNDELFGGTGRDSFVMTRGMGQDIIMDFNSREDRIDLTAFTNYTKASQVTSHLYKSGSDTILKLSSTESVIFKDISISTLKNSSAWMSLYKLPSKSNVVVGTDRSETFSGSKKIDHIDGGKGNDKFRESAGNDVLDGGAGNDTIYGGDGNDRLSGGVGNDRIYGGNGNDRIEGGAGSDLLYGQRGADTFVFKAGAGTDTIYDFTARGSEADRLEFDRALFADASDVLAHAHQSGSHVVIDIGDDHLIIKNLAIENLSTDKMLFV